MKIFNFKREIIFWAMLVVPFIYLAYAWNLLPGRVPIHFNAAGHPNGWGGKPMELLLPVVNVGVYFLLLFVPMIDPKKANYEFFETSYYKIRLLINGFLVVIALAIIHSALTTTLKIGNWVHSLVFLLFALLGNFVIHIKSNWFIGARTPWTLSSETVWKQTHLVLGRVWFYGGLFCFVLSFWIPLVGIVALTLTFAIGSVIFAYVYSYRLYQRENKGVVGEKV